MKEWKTGKLAGWKVAPMGGRLVARFNGRLVGAASVPPEVRRALAGGEPKPKAKPKPKPEPKAEPKAKPKKPKAAGCGCDLPGAALLPRSSRAAVLWVWHATARRPSRKGKGQRFLGGWPTDDAAAALRAAKAKKPGPGVLFVVNGSDAVVRTAAVEG